METELCVFVCILVFNAVVKYQIKFSLQTRSINNTLNLILSFLVKHVEPSVLILLLWHSIRNKNYFPPKGKSKINTASSRIFVARSSRSLKGYLKLLQWQTAFRDSDSPVHSQKKKSTLMVGNVISANVLGS